MNTFWFLYSNGFAKFPFHKFWYFLAILLFRTSPDPHIELILSLKLKFDPLRATLPKETKKRIHLNPLRLHEQPFFVRFSLFYRFPYLPFLNFVSAIFLLFACFLQDLPLSQRRQSTMLFKIFGTISLLFRHYVEIQPPYLHHNQQFPSCWIACSTLITARFLPFFSRHLYFPSILE